MHDMESSFQKQLDHYLHQMSTFARKSDCTTLYDDLQTCQAQIECDGKQILELGKSVLHLENCVQNFGNQISGIRSLSSNTPPSPVEGMSA